MSPRRVLTALFILASVAGLSAQRGGGGGGGGGGGASTKSCTTGEAPLSRIEQFACKLKMELKTQLAPVQQVFTDAGKEAAPIGLEMISLRQKLVNLDLTNKPATDVQPVLDAYAVQAAKMTDVETRAFQKVYATLQPFQQSKAPDAFAFMAGFFQAAATGGGRGRGGGGGGGGGGGISVELGRFELLGQAFTMDKDQKKQVKTILDDALKSAAPIQTQLSKTRTAIAVAIQGSKPQTDIDAAIKNYAAQATAMTALEMQAMAHVLQALSAEQRANAAAVSTTFFMMRGMFLDKKWDIVPDGFYGY